MKNILDKEEMSFLLAGSTCSEKGPQEHHLQSKESLAGLFPKRLSGVVAFLFLVSVASTLGEMLFRRAFGEGMYLAVFIITAVAGVLIIRRYAGPAMQLVVDAPHQSEVPEWARLLGLIRAMAGLFLMMPGPFANLLSAPCSRRL